MLKGRGYRRTHRRAVEEPVLVEHVLSVTLAFIGHSLLDVTKAVQKYAFTQ